MREKTIIDTDTGIDDAMAVLFALNSPEIEVIGCTTVHGNTELEHCTRNVLKILELTGQENIPVAMGTSAPLIRVSTYGKYVHGENGFGDCSFDEPVLQPVDEHAVDMILRLVRSHPGEITIAALGPLTNIALAVAKDRSIVPLIKRVVFMGGTYEALGNATSVATANLFHDPHAARIVYDSGIPITSVGLDVCRKFFFTAQEIEAFKGMGLYGAFIHKISTGIYLDFYSSCLGFSGYQSNDTPAIGFIAAPHLFSSVKHHVDIEICGDFTTAMTVVDYRDRSGKKKNADICIDVDASKLKDMFIKRVLLAKKTENIDTLYK